VTVLVLAVVLHWVRRGWWPVVSVTAPWDLPTDTCAGIPAEELWEHGVTAGPPWVSGRESWSPPEWWDTWP